MHQALTSELGTFYFIGIAVEAVPAITINSRNGYDGRFWPTADSIQIALNQHAEAKGRVLRAYRAMPVGRTRPGQPAKRPSRRGGAAAPDPVRCVRPRRAGFVPRFLLYASV